MERENLFSFSFFSFNFSSRLSTTSFSFFIFRLLFASNAEWWRRDVQNSPPPFFSLSVRMIRSTISPLLLIDYRQADTPHEKRLGVRIDKSTTPLSARWSLSLLRKTLVLRTRLAQQDCRKDIRGCWPGRLSSPPIDGDASGSL